MALCRCSGWPERHRIFSLSLMGGSNHWALQTDPAKRCIHSDAGQPRCHARASFELCEVAEGREVRLLHHVLYLGLVAENRGHTAVDALVVTAHQNLEKRRLADANAFDDLRVREELAVRGGHARKSRARFHGLPRPENLAS